jgi:hypothetical protein
MDVLAALLFSLSLLGLLAHPAREFQLSLTH